MNHQSKIQLLLKTLPYKLQVRYALNTAKDTKHLMKAEGLECLRVVELWLQGKATREEVRIARDATRAACDSISSAVATYPAAAAYAVNAANAAYAAYWTAKALEVDIKIYYDKLLDFVSKLSETERMVYNINEEKIRTYFLENK